MQKDQWLQIFPDAVEVSPDVYEVNVYGLGETYVGGYGALRDYLKTHEIAAESHHIVQEADAHFYPSGTTPTNAPAVALGLDLHRGSGTHNVHARLLGTEFEHQSETLGDAALKYKQGYEWSLEMPQLFRVTQSMFKTYHQEQTGQSFDRDLPSLEHDR